MNETIHTAWQWVAFIVAGFVVLRYIANMIAEDVKKWREK